MATSRELSLAPAETEQFTQNIENTSLIIDVDPGGDRGASSYDPPIKSYSITIEKDDGGAFTEVDGSPISSSSLDEESWAIYDVSQLMRITVENTGSSTGTVLVTVTDADTVDSVRSISRSAVPYRKAGTYESSTKESVIGQEHSVGEIVVQNKIVSGGEKLWEFAGNSVRKRPQPKYVDGSIYTANDDGEVFAIDARDGSQIWSAQIGDVGASSPYISEGPEYYNGVLYLGSGDNNVYAVDAWDGTVIWSYTLSDQIISSPLVANGTVYIGDTSAQFAALDARDGEEIWRQDVGFEVASKPLLANGTLYIADLTGLDAVDAKTGTEYFSGAGTGDDYTPAYADGKILTGDDSNNQLIAVDERDGSIVWEAPGVGEPKTSSVVLGDIAIVGTHDNNVAVVDIEKGEKVDEFGMSVGLDIAGTVYQNGMIHSGGSGGFQIVDAITGDSIWELNLDSSENMTEPCAVAGGKILLGTEQTVQAYTAFKRETKLYIGDDSGLYPIHRGNGDKLVTHHNPNTTMHEAKRNQNVNIRRKDSGTETQSGDGATTVFTIPHDMDRVPVITNVWAESADADGNFYVSNKTTTAIEITYETAPSSGTDNLTWGYEAKKEE